MERAVRLKEMVQERTMGEAGNGMDAQPGSRSSHRTCCSLIRFLRIIQRKRTVDKMTRIPAPIGSIEVSTYKVPTEPPDTSGLTTLFLVAVEAAGVRGIGYTYAEAATARLVRERFAPRLRDQDAFATTARSRDLQTAVRALGATEMVAAAASAVE